MRYLLNHAQYSFQVTKSVQPRPDRQAQKVNGEFPQKIDNRTGLPQWSVELTAFDNENEGSEVITVTVCSPEKPKVTVRQDVSPVDLEAVVWTNKGNAAVAYRAMGLKPVTASSSKAA